MTEGATTTPSPAKVKKLGSGYIVLTTSGGDSWVVLAIDPDAKSAASAIRAVCGTADPGDRLFVAVPARSWKPVTVARKVTTSLDIKEAT